MGLNEAEERSHCSNLGTWLSEDMMGSLRALRFLHYPMIDRQRKYGDEAGSIYLIF